MHNIIHMLTVIEINFYCNTLSIVHFLRTFSKNDCIWVCTRSVIESELNYIYPVPLFEKVSSFLIFVLQIPEFY